MNTRRDFLKLAGLSLVGMTSGCAGQEKTLLSHRKPNIIFIFIDDMGYGDLGCFGNERIKTPQIDRLARGGLRLTQFYVNSPICSPSRVAVTTGMYPARWKVHSYFDARKNNLERQMADYLDPKAPSLAGVLKQAGYATGHFGKWHMGGGRDVAEAPHPQAYGFDESLVAFEGLGDRQLVKNDGLSNASAKLEQGKIQWVEKHEMTENYVNRAIDFISRNKEKPFYINLWPNDVHDPHIPKPQLVEKYKDTAKNEAEMRFFAVLEEMDRQIGRLLDYIEQQGLGGETIILLSSDNGPTDWPSYYEKGIEPPGDAGPFRGRKWSLYEGGIRMPFIIRWKGTVPAGKTNEKSVVCGMDLFPSLCALAGVKIPSDLALDGRDMSRAFLGEPTIRQEPIFWEYPRTGKNPLPGIKKNVSPNLAVRQGQWKLLINADGSDVQLYNIEQDTGESENLTRQYPDITERLSARVLAWRKSLP